MGKENILFFQVTGGGTYTVPTGFVIIEHGFRSCSSSSMWCHWTLWLWVPAQQVPTAGGVATAAASIGTIQTRTHTGRFQWFTGTAKAWIRALPGATPRQLLLLWQTTLIQTPETVNKQQTTTKSSMKSRSPTQQPTTILPQLHLLWKIQTQIPTQLVCLLSTGEFEYVWTTCDHLRYVWTTWNMWNNTVY